jgi:hypothetical protein
MRRLWEIIKLKAAHRLVMSVYGGHHTDFVNLDILDAGDQVKGLLRWLRK